MALGIPRDEMLQRMSSREITEWIAFYSVEPFGQDTQYLGHAITAATIANTNRGKGQKAMKAEQFMPQFRNREQTVDEQIQIAQMITAAYSAMPQEDTE